MKSIEFASGDRLGVNAGAYLAIVAATIFAPGLFGASPVGLAFAGGATAAVLAYTIAGTVQATPVRLALAGVAVALVCSALTAMLQLFYENQTAGLLFWGAGSLVQRVILTRIAILTVAVALAAVAVSIVGAIGFVGLIGPHTARILLAGQHQHRKLVPMAAILGALLVTLADTIGRVALAPKEIPAGLVTAMIGAPYFLWLLWRGRAG